ncbi:MAG: 4-hydroxy-tetrahydrodipicolinate reductase [Steroidobacteraceae bacterium]
MLRVLIIGAAGRMGRALVHAARERSDVQVVAGVESPGSAHVGQDIGEIAGVGVLGVTLGSDLSAALTDCDAAVDFSHPSATAANLAACVGAGKPLLIGTTGFPADVHHELERAARHIPLLVSANMSIAVTLLTEMARQCARALPLHFDVEIVEAHHRHKKDAPSGTALALGHAIAEARGQQLDQVAMPDRSGHGPRREGEIGFAVVRGGDIVGDHTVIFAGAGEQLILTHRATDRAVFARGALDAAVWLARRPPGRYFIHDLLPK